MSILRTFNGNPILLLTGIFFIFLSFVILYQLYKKYPKLLFPLLVVAALFAMVLFKSSSFKNRLFYRFAPRTPIVFLYDTDPRNNEYIKGDLSERQLYRLDRILLDEKKMSGLRLSDLRLNELAANNNDIIDAYDRWRKCKDMYRSYHKIVYPDERQRVLQERR